MIKNDQDIKNNDDNIQGTVADQHRSFVRLIQAKTVLTGLKTHQRHIDMRQVIGRQYDDDEEEEYEEQNEEFDDPQDDGNSIYIAARQMSLSKPPT